MQAGVRSTPADELARRAVLDDASCVENEHAIGDLHRRETVGDDDGGPVVAESVYKVIELVGTSTESWEKAAAAAVEKAAGSLRDLRIAQVAELDMQIEGGAVKAYRAKVKVSFKYED